MHRAPILDQVFREHRAVVRIAAAAGITPAAVSQWTRVPKRHVEVVAQLTGIAPHKLRPDLFQRGADR